MQIVRELNLFHYKHSDSWKHTLVTRSFAPEIAERLMRDERVDFGEFTLYNRYFERNKPVDWDWNDIVNRFSFGNTIKHPITGKFWYCVPPAMPYSWTGYPSLNLWSKYGPIKVS